MRLIDADALMDYCNNLKDKTIDANDIARFPTIGGWTSVKDRMPEKHGHYLVIRDNGYMSVDTYSRSSHWGKDVCKITHWMPLPEPPEEAVRWVK